MLVNAILKLRDADGSQIAGIVHGHHALGHHGQSSSEMELPGAASTGRKNQSVLALRGKGTGFLPDMGE